ncbi:MAG: HAD-IA family hydrolase [Rectinemataceae bacterium]
MVYSSMLRAMLFDLDNTLYSESTGMEDGVVLRMNDFVASWLGVSHEEGIRLRREGVRRYGTSLEWLIKEKGFKDTEVYLQAVHPEGEEWCIRPDPELGLLLDSIPLPKAILTNAPREHAERVLRKLGISDRFKTIYDLRFNGLVGKPAPDAFLKPLADFGYSVGETLFIDDLPKYARGYSALGGRAVLKDEGDRYADQGFERIRSLAELPALLVL